MLPAATTVGSACADTGTSASEVAQSAPSNAMRPAREVARPGVFNVPVSLCCSSERSRVRLPLLFSRRQGICLVPPAHHFLRRVPVLTLTLVRLFGPGRKRDALAVGGP